MADTTNNDEGNRLTKDQRDKDAALFAIQKDYYFGKYQSCVNKANSMESMEEATFYMCLSYCHMKKYDNLQLEVSKSNYKSVELVGTFANYIRNRESREAIINEIDSLIESQSIKASDHLPRLIISAIYVRNGLYDKALSVLNEYKPNSWETVWRTIPISFATIEILLLMNRLDLAEQELLKMQSRDDFSTITKLAIILVRLASNRPREAQEIALELEDKNSASPLLKNLQTAAAISMGDYTAAKQHCDIALDLDNDNLEALINMTHILSNLKSSTEIRVRNFERIKSLYPEHDFVKEFVRLEEELKPFIQMREETA